MAHLKKRATEPVYSIAENHSIPLTDISTQIHPNPVKQFYHLRLQEKHQAHQQLLQQQQTMPQNPLNIYGIPLPQKQMLQQSPHPQPMQQHHIVQQNFQPMQQMVQHPFPHQPHFIAKIHPQFVIPLTQPIFLQQCKNITLQHIPQQPAVVEHQPASN